MRVLLAVILLFSAQTQAAKAIVSDEGREVQLNPDGSWEYKSTDRFATVADGRRVRLSADGKWSYTGEKSAAVEKIALDRQYVDQKSLDIVLSNLVIETVRGKKSPGSKNPRKKTRSVFYITLGLDKTANRAFSVALDANDFTVEDTDGRSYPVTAVTPANIAIEPADETVIAVYADGSPHWWTTKAMVIKINKAVFSSTKTIALSRAMSVAKKKVSDSFE